MATRPPRELGSTVGRDRGHDNSTSRVLDDAVAKSRELVYHRGVDGRAIRDRLSQVPTSAGSSSRQGGDTARESAVVRILPPGTAPDLSRVQGTDAAEIGLFSDRATGMAIVVCALDNLGKGAAGQAVQNANLVLGLGETAGLRLSGVLV